MSTQALPEPLQRRHWYANEVGLPAHAPVSTVTVVPACAVPEIKGVAVDVGEPGGPATTAVELELVAIEPRRFRPVTVTRRVEARSPVETEYVGAVAPDERGAPGAGRVAALPLVGERELITRPGAAGGREREPRLGGTGDERR